MYKLTKIINFFCEVIPPYDSVFDGVYIVD